MAQELGYQSKIDYNTSHLELRKRGNHDNRTGNYLNLLGAWGGGGGGVTHKATVKIPYIALTCIANKNALLVLYHMHCIPTV